MHNFTKGTIFFLFVVMSSAGCRKKAFDEYYGRPGNNLSQKLTATTNLSYTCYEQNLSDQGLALKTNPLYLSLIQAPFLHKSDVSDAGVVSPNIHRKFNYK